MRILFSGDSITLGSQGVSYVKKVMAEIPGARHANIACNGETLNMMSERLLRHLKMQADYDVIVIAGGLGDAAFPLLKSMGMMFRFAYAAQEFIGMKPARDADDFQHSYQKLIDSVKAISSAKLVLVTLNCIGEKPGFPPYLLRNNFNKRIRQLAIENELVLADPGSLIDEYLSANEGSAYFLGNFWKLTYSDKLFAMSKSGFDWLSRRRKLTVTFDGLHLNSAGAEIFAKALLESFKKNGILSS